MLSKRYFESNSKLWWEQLEASKYQFRNLIAYIREFRSQISLKQNMFNNNEAFPLTISALFLKILGFNLKLSQCF